MTAQQETLGLETEHPAQGLPGHPFSTRPGQEQGNSSPLGQPVVDSLSPEHRSTISILLPSLPGSPLHSPTKLSPKSQPPCNTGEGGVWKRLFAIDSMVPTQSSLSSRFACLLVFKRRGWKRGKEEEMEHEMHRLFPFRQSKSTLCGLLLRAQQAGN